MSYTGAVKYLYDLQKHSIKLGLERTEKLLAVLHNPHREFLCVHVAGTNGKGSVAAMISSMLMSGGSRVGLFTSPHMVSFTERIRINNTRISEAEVAQLTGEIKEIMAPVIARGGEPTFFEFVTAMAFLYFARNNVDWAVIEAGMGGRLDATNTVRPAVSVITEINYDHKEFLGNSLEEIASEKAGIIKNNVPVVCSAQAPGVERILSQKAAAGSSPISIYGKDFFGTLESTNLTGTSFGYRSGKHAIEKLHVPLAGEHQVVNACVAVKAYCVLRSAFCVTPPMPPLAKGGIKGEVDPLPKGGCSTRDAERSTLNAIRQGLASVRWPGRLELVPGNPPIILDGAHNPHAAHSLAEFMRKQFANYRIVLIAGIMSDKDINGILAPLLPLVSDIIFTALNYGRAAAPAMLAERAAVMGYQSAAAPSMREAIALAGEIALLPQPGLPALAVILITGSFFTIGEVKELLGEKAVLGDLREKYGK